MREGRIAARLQHSNAISVYDVAEDEGQPVLVMEYLPSTSLAAMMSDHGPLPPREVARIGAEVASALGAAHAAGVVHRDIKPGNILLGDNGQVKITDFGISRAQGDVQVTKTGMLAGTPAYLSPDVAMGQEPTPASDVFSLGATLYAAIEGHPPFGLNENTLALLHAVAAGKIEPPQQAGPMAQPLMAMMAARVQDRPDMAQSREMLQAVADGGSVNSIPTMAAPIPPALAPEAPDNATSVMGSGAAAGTTVAYYEDDPYSERPYEDATSYMGADTRADSAAYEEPRRSKRPVIISAIALVAVAVIAVLVTSALRGPEPPPQQPANQPTEAPQVPPPPPETTTEEETSTKQTRTSTRETQSSSEETPTSAEEPTSTPSEPTSSDDAPTSQRPTRTSTTQSGSVTTQ